MIKMSPTQIQTIVHLIKALFPYLLGAALTWWLIVASSNNTSPSKSSASSTCYQEHWNSTTQKMSPTVYQYLQKYPGMTPGQVAAKLCE